MRLFLTIGFLTLCLIDSFAQSAGRRPKTAVFSVASEWQMVTIKPAASLQASQPHSASTTSVSQVVVVAPIDRPEPVIRTNPAEAVAPVRTAPLATATPDFRPAFTGDFSTNRNGWKAGNKGDYYYQIGLGRYSIRKRNVNTKYVAFSAVELPADINMNIANIFTIKVDVLADSGRIPTGGVLFGVRDSLNYCAFTINSKGEASIIRVANGKTASDYMPGEFFAPGVAVEKNRNRLSIQRRDDILHFYINAQEVRSSPYPFKMLPGNGIGLTSSAYWTSFQKLSVTLGP